jgi:Protein of unknown function (DUF2793)
MPPFETARHNLPLLVVSQAQKEITHNEALVRIDALMHPVIESELAIPPALSDADIGKCWLIAETPLGDWTGRAGQIAIWIGGGWRFCVAIDGMRLRLRTSGADMVRAGGTWIASPAIPDPLVGTVIDIEARAAIVALLNHFRVIGLLAS